MKKFLLFFLLLFASRVFCSEVITLKFGHNLDEEELKCVKVFVNIFRQSYPNVNIEPLELTGVLKLKFAREEGNLPDFVLIRADEIPDLVKEDLIIPLDEYLKEIDVQDFYSVLFESVKYKGNFWAIPVDGNTFALIYNKDMFNKAKIKNPPKSWEELIKIAKKLTLDTNKDGKIEQWGFNLGDEEILFLTLLLQNNGKLIDVEKKQALFNTDEGIKSLQFLVDIFHKNKVFPLSQHFQWPPLDFSSAMGIVFADEVPKFKERGINFGIAPLPKVKNDFIILPSNYCVAILKTNIERQRLSFEFLKWFTSPDVFRQWCMLTNFVPIRKSITNSKIYIENYLKKNPHIKIFICELEKAKAFPLSRDTVRIKNILSKNIKNAIYKISSSKESLAFAKQEIENVMKACACAWDSVEQGRISVANEKSPFGIVHDSKFDLMSRCGIRWVRTDFSWNSIEKNKGEFNFNDYNILVNTAKENNIEILPILDYWAIWDSLAKEDVPNKELFVPKDHTNFINYVEKTVSYFKARIKYWEVWNEPGGFFRPVADIKEYTKLLKESSYAIKKIDPTAKVIGGGGVGLGELEEIFKSGANDYMDIISIHPYNYPTSPDKFLIENIKYTKKIIDKFGGKQRIWITEIGWPTHKGAKGVSEELQAAYLVRTYVLALSTQLVDKIFWYCFPSGDDPEYNEANFGIVRSDLSPKPAYNAYKTMTNFLEGAEYVKEENLEKDIACYVFRRYGGNFAVIWNRENQKKDLELQNKNLDATNMYGEKINLERKGNIIFLPTSSSPIFVGGWE